MWFILEMAMSMRRQYRRLRKEKSREKQKVLNAERFGKTKGVVERGSEGSTAPSSAEPRLCFSMHTARAEAMWQPPVPRHTLFLRTRHHLQASPPECQKALLLLFPSSCTFNCSSSHMVLRKPVFNCVGQWTW